MQMLWESIFKEPLLPLSGVCKSTSTLKQSMHSMASPMLIIKFTRVDQEREETSGWFKLHDEVPRNWLTTHKGVDSYDFTAEAKTWLYVLGSCLLQVTPVIIAAIMDDILSANLRKRPQGDPGAYSSHHWPLSCAIILECWNTKMILRGTLQAQSTHCLKRGPRTRRRRWKLMSYLFHLGSSLRPPVSQMDPPQLQQDHMTPWDHFSPHLIPCVISSVRYIE